VWCRNSRHDSTRTWSTRASSIERSTEWGSLWPATRTPFHQADAMCDTSIAAIVAPPRYGIRITRRRRYRPRLSLGYIELNPVRVAMVDDPAHYRRIASFAATSLRWTTLALCFRGSWPGLRNPNSSGCCSPFCPEARVRPAASESRGPTAPGRSLSVRAGDERRNRTAVAFCAGCRVLI